MFLISFNPGDDGDGIGRDEFIDNVAKDILLKLPKQFDLITLKKTLQMNISPTGVVLLQELERFNALVNRMLVSLGQLRKALAGEIGMDTELDNIAIALYNGELPANWRHLCPETCKRLAGWMDHLLRREQQYKSWAVSGEPMVIWLSGLHIPESFLTALVQIACRKNNWPLDRSAMYTYVTKYGDPDDIEAKAATGCYITGLYLEGARWDMTEMCLKKSLAKVLVEPLSILAMVPVQAHRLTVQNTFRTPAYTTSRRRNAMGVGLVFEADLGTKDHTNQWILQGVCLLLNTD